MPNVKEAAKIMVDAETLWREVGDFGSVARWHPLVSGMTVTDTPAGKTRLAHFEAGGQQLERLAALDTGHRVYRYTIERTSLPVRDYNGEFRVEEVDAHTSRLVWEAQFTLVDESDDRTIEAVRHFLHDGAASIQEKYRPYVNREPGGVDTGIADADKKARTDSLNEPIRNTPPAGAWNDTSSD